MLCQTRPPRLRSKSLLVHVFAGAALVLTGCSSSRTGKIDNTLPDVFPGHSIAQVESYLNGAADTLLSFAAKANVSVNSPTQSLRFGSVIDHRKGDSLYMNVKVTLGIEAARALVTPDSFFVYDRLKKKLYFGDISRAGRFSPSRSTATTCSKRFSDCRGRIPRTSGLLPPILNFIN